MSSKRRWPRTVRGRAPWHWSWGRIAVLALQCGAWWTALRWSPLFGLALALWIYAQLRAAYTEPLPSPTGGEGPDEETAGRFAFVQDDPDRPHHWRVTQSE